MSLDLFDLTGRVAVVTGAGSGIGRASARLLAAAGASVVCLDRDGEAATATADLAGDRASPVEIDVADREAVDAAVAAAAGTHGRLDVMCNVAGIMTNAAVADLDETDLDRVLAVNLKGVLFGCQAAVRVMRGGGGGSIVNMSSSAIDAAAPLIGAYAMSKAAVAQLTKTLAVEVGADRIRVNAVAPGFVETGMTARHFVRPDGTVDAERREAVLKPMRARSPLRRIGEPEDVARTVLYLASDASSFVTGQTLRTNGGVAMPW